MTLSQGFADPSLKKTVLDLGLVQFGLKQGGGGLVITRDHKICRVNRSVIEVTMLYIIWILKKLIIFNRLVS